MFKHTNLGEHVTLQIAVIKKAIELSEMIEEEVTWFVFSSPSVDTWLYVDIQWLEELSFPLQFWLLSVQKDSVRWSTNVFKKNTVFLPYPQHHACESTYYITYVLYCVAHLVCVCILCSWGNKKAFKFCSEKKRPSYFETRAFHWKHSTLLWHVQCPLISKPFPR